MKQSEMWVDRVGDSLYASFPSGILPALLFLEASFSRFRILLLCTRKTDFATSVPTTLHAIQIVPGWKLRAVKVSLHDFAPPDMVLSARIFLFFTLQGLQVSDFYRVHVFSAETWSDMSLSHYKKQKSWPVRMKRLKEISDQKDLKIEFSSVSHLVMSGSLRPRELLHTRPPRPSSTPGVYSSSCLSSRWCHLTTSSSVVPFSSQPQSFPASGSFQMSQLFASAGQSIGVSASASVLPVNTQDWFPLGWTGWISLQSKGLSRVFSNTTVQKHQFLALSFFYSPTLTSIRDYWKNHSFD